MDLSTVESETLLSGRSDWLGPDAAERLAHHPLESIETEYPHYVGSVDSPDDIEPPSDRHPVFYGCFDWHSAVHSHWALVRGLRLFDDHPEADRITDSIDDRLTPENAQREASYLAEHNSFEKPYGWAWLLHLAAELDRWDDDRAERWAAALDPLERAVRSHVAEWLPTDRAFRVGTHGNTAFALHCLHDYATATGDDDLEGTVAETAERLFAADRDYPLSYEPLGWDFLSPGLTEADLMRRVLEPKRFTKWVEEFLPDVEALPEPVAVSPEPDKGVALHLVGLNLARAWSAAGVADALDGHRYADPFREVAANHAEAGLDAAFTDDYAGAHWLSSFALYLLTHSEGGIAPAVSG